MSVREEERRRWRRDMTHADQMWRGIDKYAPAGTEGPYLYGVYPLISRRGREIPYQDEPM